jgi:hypothetical protein
VPLGQIPGVAGRVQALLDHVRAVSGLPLRDAHSLDDDRALVRGVRERAAALDAARQRLAAAADTGASDGKPPALNDGVDESILQSPAKFHFTVLMLSLPTAEHVERARQLQPALEEAARRHLSGVALHLAGLKVMSHMPRETHVLYVDLDDGTVTGDSGAAAGRRAFSAFVDEVHRMFGAAGLVSDKGIADGQKIHATLMNTKWRMTRRVAKEDVSSDRTIDGTDEVRPFDATNILEVLGNVTLGVVAPVSEVHVSRREAARIVDDAWPWDLYFDAEFVVRV